jgi:hypothetical protein
MERIWRYLVWQDRRNQDLEDILVCSAYVGYQK